MINTGRILNRIKWKSHALYRVQQSFPESSGFQYSERTIASTETNITSAESPWSKLSFGTLKVGVASSWGCNALIEGKKSKTLRADLCFLRRGGVTPSWWCHAHFQGVKLKLRSRAFCWCIVCFCTSNGSFRILKKAGGNIFHIFLHF